MKATETTLQAILNKSEQQFIVPLFQRTYSWDKKEWEDLWEDILELLEFNSELKASDKLPEHFLGSIVTIPISTTPHGITKYLLIDGQQRLTTLFILLALVKNKIEDKKIAEKIYDLNLVNKYAEGENFYRLLPTQQDREAFCFLMQSSEEIPEKFANSRIINCYRFFEKITQKVNLETLNKIISYQLTVVSITLDANENPHLVFESLNARGKPLTQADLIRNYFFMRVKVEEQEAIFEKYWQPMQEALGESLTEYIRHYLIAITAKAIKKTDVYISLKQWVDNNAQKTSTSEQAEIELRNLAIFASYYEKILSPEKEPCKNVKIALERIKRIEVTVAYPFILKCYHDYANKKLTDASFCEVLHFVENIVMRRFICSLPSNALNKIFPSVYKEACKHNSSNFVKGVASVLQNKGYPNDDKLKEALMTTSLYRGSENYGRCKLVLESIEESYCHKEQTDLSKLQIEHIMPQTIKKGSWWQQHLGENWEAVQDLYLHTLGNLTLTAYNSEMSNKAFYEKKEKLLESHLELNRYFSHMDTWKEEDIKQRTEKLAQIVLQIWAHFGDNPSSDLSKKRLSVKGKKPVKMRIKNKLFPLKLWRDVLVETLSFLISEKNECLDILIERFPKFLGRDSTMFSRAAKLPDNYYVKTNLEAEHIYLFCQQAIEICGYTQDDWEVEYQ